MQGQSTRDAGVRIPQTRVSVRGYITLGFALMIVILLTVIAGSAWLAHEHRSALSEAERNAHQAELLKEAQTASTTELTIILLYIASGDESSLQNLAEYETRALAAVSAYIDLAVNGGEQDDVEAFQKLVGAGLTLTSTWNQAITLRSQGDVEGAAALIAGSLADTQAITTQFEELSANEQAEVAALRTRADKTADLAFWMLIASGLFAAVAAIGAGFFVVRSVVQPISGLHAAAEAIASGDLEARAPTGGPKEVAEVGAAFNEMTEALLDASKRRELEGEREQAYLQLARAHNQLEETTSRLNGLLTSINDVIYAVTPHTYQVLYLNQAVEDVYGHPASEFKENGALWMEVVHREDREIAARLGIAVLENGYAEGEYRIVRPDGEVRWVRARVRLVTNESGVPVRIDGINTDVTERKAAEDALRTSEERFRALVQNAQDIITVLSPAGIIEFESPSIEAVLGYEPHELVGKRAIEYIHQDDSAEVARTIAVGVQDPGSQHSVQFRFRHKDGSWRYLESIGMAISDGGSTTIIVNSRDVTERKQAEEMMKYMAYHDPLTRLPNRALFEDRAEVAFAQAERAGSSLGILSIDIDRLKLVNDTLGHPAGDDLLKSAALRLADCIRESDTVARVGGDEFLVLLTECKTAGDAERVAERIRNAFQTPFETEGSQMNVTVSIGASIYPQHGMDLRTLLKNADAAMYAAKEAGRNGYRMYSRDGSAALPSEGRDSKMEPATAGDPDRY
jgi:diguanylate cyclase (GGDEF)-like protein/PAS domain S-box-containing protein